MTAFPNPKNLFNKKLGKVSVLGHRALDVDLWPLAPEEKDGFASCAAGQSKILRSVGPAPPLLLLNELGKFDLIKIGF